MINTDKVIDCRKSCGACCIAPSISSPLPGMPNGKPAGVRCEHLTKSNDCALFGSPERPQICIDLKPSNDMCGADQSHALNYLKTLEELTQG